MVLFVFQIFSISLLPSAWFYFMEGMEMDFGWSVLREVGRMPFFCHNSLDVGQKCNCLGNPINCWELGVISDHRIINLPGDPQGSLGPAHQSHHVLERVVHAS